VTQSYSIGIAALATAAIFITAIPTFAHHPFDLEFDWTKPVTMAGTITRVGWDGPHSTLAIQPRDQTATQWVVELGSPKVLEKNYEWTPNLVKVGDNITVDGWLAKDGRRFVSAKSVTLSNGKKLFGASSFYDVTGRCVSDEVCVEKAPSSYQEPSTTGQR
jgi:hypothetical protein